MYLTYDEYTEMGGTLDETAFIDLEYEARTYIDWVTFNRLWKEETIPARVKECEYHILKLIQSKLDALNPSSESDTSLDGTNKTIASQSNDGVSISYNVLSAKDIIEASDKELQKTIHRYLDGVRNNLGYKLLYRGIYPGETSGELEDE